MVFDFLQPVNSECLGFIDNLSTQSLGKKVTFHTSTDFPNLDNISVAVFVVNEYRGADYENKENDVDFFRKNFYKLYPGNWKVAIADLGTIQAGESIDDTYFLVQTICEDLIRKKIIPIVIGGGQDISYPIYRAYDNLDQMVNFVSIDNKFDFAKEDSNNDIEFNRVLWHGLKGDRPFPGPKRSAFIFPKESEPD